MTKTSLLFLKQLLKITKSIKTTSYSFSKQYQLHEYYHQQVQILLQIKTNTKILKFRTKTCHKDMENVRNAMFRCEINSNSGILIIQKMNPYEIFLQMIHMTSSRWFTRLPAHDSHGRFSQKNKGDLGADIQTTIGRYGSTSNKGFRRSNSINT